MYQLGGVVVLKVGTTLIYGIIKGRHHTGIWYYLKVGTMLVVFKSRDHIDMWYY